MSFRIHIVGAGGFHYSRDVRHDGGEWEIGWVKARLISWSIGPPRPSQSAGNPILAASVGATVAALREFSDMITHLSVFGVSRLNLVIRREHLAWPTTGGMRTFFLSGASVGTIPGDICDFLNENGMNRWGVLFQMNRALAGYGGGSIVNVTLSD